MLKSLPTPPSKCSGGTLNRSKIPGLLRFGQILIGAALLTMLSGNAKAAVVVGSIDDGFVPTTLTPTDAPLSVPILGSYIQLGFPYGQNEQPYIYTGPGMQNFGYISSGWYTNIYQYGDSLPGAIFGQNAYVSLENNNDGPAEGLTGTEDRYLGFSDGGTNFGWIQFRYNDAADSLTVVDYAYGTAGEQLLAGSVTPVPEPGSAVLALAGAAGFVFRRRRPRAA